MKTSYLDDEKYKKMLGIYIKEQREQLKITHKELSKASHINSSRLKKIENGEVHIRIETLERLKTPLLLNDDHLNKIEDVAKVAFIENLVRLLNCDANKDSHA